MSVLKGVCGDTDIDTVWHNYRLNKEPFLRNILINYYLERTKALSAKLYSLRQSNIAEYNDYLHFGILGLIGSIDRYNPSRGAQFFTYASYRIKGSIISGIASMEEYTASDSNKFIFRARLQSINDYQDEGDDLFESMVDTSVMLAIGMLLENSESSDSEQYINQSFTQLQSSLNNYINILETNQSLVIKYHYFHQLQFVTIAEILKLTKARVSQLHNDALTNLRKKYSASIELEL